MNDDEALEHLEVDLDVAECIEILESYGVDWPVDLVTALWDWKHAGSDV